MKCQHCSKEATVHLTEIEEGTVRDRHFCAPHGKAYAATQHLDYAADCMGERIVVPVEVTQSQIDSGETVEVKLPQGGSARLKLPKGANAHWTMVQVRRTANPSVPVYAFTIRVVG